MTNKLILDPASSMRSFYFNKKDKRVLFGDIREKETHLLTNGQTIHIEPDQVMDFRNIPYPDKSFQCVVFDPPHMLRLSEKSWMRKKYGVLDDNTWQEDLTKGFFECFRVLKINGTLIFKWNEVSIPLKEILKLTPPSTSQSWVIHLVKEWEHIGFYLSRTVNDNYCLH